MTDVLISRSPQDPDVIVGEVARADHDSVRAAVSGAREAFDAWAATPAAERATLLNQAADDLQDRSAELVGLMVAEVGKPVTEARGEFTRAVGILRFNAQLALDPLGELLPADRPHSTLMTRRRPHGVVGLITPWNFPVAIPLWKAAPALAVGNCVVIKPSPESAVTAEVLAQILNKSLPPGVLSVVHGEGPAGAALVESVDAMSFTGSTAVGSSVVLASAGRGIPVQAEMGGHNPGIILPDCDTEIVARQLAYAIAGYAGQKCTATRRVITVGDRPDLVEALTSALDELTVGDPALETTVVGPLISAAARTRVAAAVRQAVDIGAARVTTQSGADRVPQRGHFFPPTLLAGADASAGILREEVFGPVAAVITARDDDDAVRIANGVEYGLTGAVYGRDLDRATRIADRLRAGMVKVNEPTTGANFHAPFGGEGASSFGPREQGRAALQMYTWSQTVTVSPA